MSLGEDILEKTLNGMTPSNAPSLNEQQAGDMEMQLAKLIPEQVRDELEEPAGPTKPAGVKLVEGITTKGTSSYSC